MTRLGSTPATPSAAGFPEVHWGALPWLVGAAFLALVLVLGGVNKRDGRRFGFLYGEDNRRSTSKLTAFAWTAAVVAGCAVLLAAVVGIAGVTLATVRLDQLDEQYLVLIGAPLLALVAAKGIVESKTQEGTLQKPAAESASEGFTKNDAGQADLIDIQYLSVNALLLAYFVMALVDKGELPELPSSLVGLTGASAAVYVANKAATGNNPPVIEAATTSPVSGGTGTVVTINGRNLLPPDRAKWVKGVSVSGVTVTSVSAWDEDATQITANVDAAPTAGAVVVVTTKTGATTTAKIE